MRVGREFGQGASYLSTWSDHFNYLKAKWNKIASILWWRQQVGWAVYHIIIIKRVCWTRNWPTFPHLRVCVRDKSRNMHQLVDFHEWHIQKSKPITARLSHNVTYNYFPYNNLLWNSWILLILNLFEWLDSQMSYYPIWTECELLPVTIVICSHKQKI